VMLVLVLAVLGYIVQKEKPFRGKSPFPLEMEHLPKAPVILEPAPTDMVEALTPPWQKQLTAKLRADGYGDIGDYSYSSSDFFWARVLIAPDQKSVLLLVNWKEGGQRFRQAVANLEIYSLSQAGSFLLTACAQDGASRLLTGANRPSAEQMSLHLKMVFNETGVKPLLEEHQQRLKAWEEKGTVVLKLAPESVLAGLSKIFS
jgi:hypothetical protein